MISELYVQIDRNNGKNAHVFEKIAGIIGISIL